MFGTEETNLAMTGKEDQYNEVIDKIRNIDVTDKLDTQQQNTRKQIFQGWRYINNFISGNKDEQLTIGDIICELKYQFGDDPSLIYFVLGNLFMQVYKKSDIAARIFLLGFIKTKDVSMFGVKVLQILNMLNIMEQLTSYSYATLRQYVRFIQGYLNQASNRDNKCVYNNILALAALIQFEGKFVRKDTAAAIRDISSLIETDKDKKNEHIRQHVTTGFKTCLAPLMDKGIILIDEIAARINIHVCYQVALYYEHTASIFEAQEDFLDQSLEFYVIALITYVLQLATIGKFTYCLLDDEPIEESYINRIPRKIDSLIDKCCELIDRLTTSLNTYDNFESLLDGSRYNQTMIEAHKACLQKFDRLKMLKNERSIITTQERPGSKLTL